MNDKKGLYSKWHNFKIGEESMLYVRYIIISWKNIQCPLYAPLYDAILSNWDTAYANNICLGTARNILSNVFIYITYDYDVSINMICRLCLNQ